MKLFGAYPSHFTRKVRVVLQELGLDYQFSALSALLETSPEHFAQNPLLQLPILIDGEQQIIESDLICAYLLDKHGRNSPGLRFFPTLGDKYHHQKRLAVMNGGMSAGARIMRAKRSNIPNFMESPFFKQDASAIQNSLKWLENDLEKRTRYQEGEFNLLDITLVCFADWAIFREIISSLAAFPAIANFVEANKARPSLANTHPALEAPAR
jgi:glutathione S-transferase